MGHLVLVTGGARSGKSAIAESRLAALCEPPFTYVATSAVVGDSEWDARVEAHRRRRPAERWTTVEAPRDVADAISATQGALVDCVTLWLSNLMAPGLHEGAETDGLTDEEILDEAERLGAAAQAAPGPVVIVTNEVGGGLVPDTAIGRRFRDLQGWVNQRLAARADEVHLAVAGLSLRIK